MIRRNGFQVVLLVAGFVIWSIAGCNSGSSDGSQAVLRVLITNDDGVAAEGIDVIVEALTADPNNEVTVCAPDVNKSGSSDMTDCGTGDATDTTTQSGYPATAVDGCPADAVNYALDPENGLYAADGLPHLVISGINEGQNVSQPIATSRSGTVGAAKTAARDHGVPALATSQGSSLGPPSADAEYDFDSGAQAVLAWLAEHRSALLAGSVATSEVDSINTPTCTAGQIRGTREVPLDPVGADAFKPQDCESTLDDPQTDVEAFITGFNALTPVPAN